MRVRYTLKMEKELPEFDHIKDMNECMDAIEQDMAKYKDDYTDGKVLSIDDDIEVEGFNW